jgi:hypothetical protein
MIDDYMYNNEMISEYFYRPAENIVYVWLDIYDEDGKYIQYGGKDFLQKFIEIKNSFGDLLAFDIINIKYDFDLFSFYDYGYPHRIIIKLKCFYNDYLITSEMIHGYYIKEIDKINIVSYSISPQRPHAP